MQRNKARKRNHDISSSHALAVYAFPMPSHTHVENVSPPTAAAPGVVKRIAAHKLGILHTNPLLEAVVGAVRAQQSEAPSSVPTVQGPRKLS
jgi:hypothetical protein